jgi:hypothetical protein
MSHSERTAEAEQQKEDRDKPGKEKRKKLQIRYLLKSGERIQRVEVLLPKLGLKSVLMVFTL